MISAWSPECHLGFFQRCPRLLVLANFPRLTPESDHQHTVWTVHLFVKLMKIKKCHKMWWILIFLHRKHIISSKPIYLLILLISFCAPHRTVSTPLVDDIRCKARCCKDLSEAKDAFWTPWQGFSNLTFTFEILFMYSRWSWLLFVLMIVFSNAINGICGLRSINLKKLPSAWLVCTPPQFRLKK